LKKIKSIHIHTDLKFIGETELFEGRYFENKIIAIGKKQHYSGPYADDISYIKRNYFGLKRIIDICNRSDFVILYDLDKIKSVIANSISKDVKIAWRFFGYELYSKIKEELVSPESKAQLDEQKKPDIFHGLSPRNILSRLKPINLITDSSFEKAVSRTDFFLCLSRMEYNELLQSWPDLPECVEISIWDNIKHRHPSNLWNKKEPVLILGNNRSIYNNHPDIIKKMDKRPKTSEYKIIVPFSYGPSGDYALGIRSILSDKENYTLLEDFLPLSDYRNIIERAYALVINSYRQIGMDNIFMAIESGVKVYLNRKNIIYTWLNHEGIKVHSVESLMTDLDKGEIRLSPLEIESNIQALCDLKERYPKSQFQKIMFEKVRYQGSIVD
jgi:dTDP-N-acetylfucosamine:lipid II N-acetylfucosaminyltransferase